MYFLPVFFFYAFLKITVILGAKDVSDIAFYPYVYFLCFHDYFMLVVTDYVETVLANESTLARIKWEMFIYSWRV